MARCPQCNRFYDDSLSFCLDDGSNLLPDGVSASEMPTADFRNTPTFNKAVNDTVAGPSVPTQDSIRTGGTSTSTAIVIALVAVGVLVLVGAVGLAGLLFYSASDRDRDRAASTPTPGVESSRTPSTPLTTQTPDPEDIYPDNKTVEVRNGKKPIPKQISVGVMNGKATSLPKPSYPPAARAVRASGAVSVQVTVDESGRVVSAVAVTGHALLRAAAVSAARQAKFSPTLLSGQPVKVVGIITYNFVPPRSSSPIFTQ